MALLDMFRRAPSKKEGTVNINDPAFLEMIMGGRSALSRVSPGQAVQIAAVYACVKVLAETVMTLPCELKKVQPDGTRIVSPGEPLHRLVSAKPNSFMTAAEWWAWNVKCICLRGNSYNFLVRAGGRVVEILPIHPDNVSVDVLQPGNRIIYKINTGGTPRPVTSDEILHFKNPMLEDDGILGMSPIAANGHTLGGAIESRDWANKVFVNSATPRGILHTDESLSDEAYDNIKKSWNETHAGPDNANKVAILEAGLKFSAISMSPEDVELITTRQFSRTEIAGIFRVPPHMIADLSDATFSNITMQSLDFYKNSVAPWLRTFEQRLDFSLLGDSTRLFKFDVNELIRGDMETEAEAYERLVGAQIITPNEARDRLGMGPREGGDEVVEIPKPTQESSDDGDA